MSDTQAEADSIILATEQAMATEGLTPIKLLVIGEVIDDSGERWIFKATSRDFRAWDAFGFLQWANARETAGIAADYRRENDDD